MHMRRLTIGLLAATAVLAPIGTAEAKKKPSCKVGKEQKGCRLPTGAQYRAPDGRSVFVSVLSYNFGVTSILTGPGACAPTSQGTPMVQAIEQKKVKVGKTYKLASSRHSNGVTASLAGKLTFTSAKKAKINAQASYTPDGGPTCSKTLKQTLNRVTR